MKRLYRNLSDATRLKISQKLRGRTMSDTQKAKISDAMKQYWASIPMRPKNNNTSTDEGNEEQL